MIWDRLEVGTPQNPFPNALCIHKIYIIACFPTKYFARKIIFLNLWFRVRKGDVLATGHVSLRSHNFFLKRSYAEFYIPIEIFVQSTDFYYEIQHFLDKKLFYFHFKNGPKMITAHLLVKCPNIFKSLKM